MAWSQPHLTNPPMGPTDEIRKLQHRLLFAYSRARGKELGVTESGIFDSPTAVSLTIMQRYLVTLDSITALNGRKLVLRPEEFGTLTYDTKLALGVIPPAVPMPTPAPPPSIICFSINGAGSTWNMGYPFDIGELLDKRKCFHQPIGYDTNPFPMSKGVKTGVTEFINQLERHHCDVVPWTAVVYSMGAIVFMTVLMRILHGDLQRFKSTYRGSVAFGNPMREQDHSFPGCSYSDGEGIAWTKDVHDTPVEHWDMACDKRMEGASGDDLYTKLNKDGTSEQQVKDMRAIWAIVNTGNPLSLAMALASIPKDMFGGSVAAAKAAFAALDFFIVKQLTPHTSYQFIHPIDGDPRDSWRISLDYINSIVASVPQR